MDTPFSDASCLLAKSPGYVIAVRAAAVVASIRVELLKEVVCEDVGLDSVVSVVVCGHETSLVIDDQEITDRQPSEELQSL
ncbi:hypothetical protein BGZ96_012254 [Linnemannia gamsii]|uniref:Uncharacterized protein n=1 Tax=Linnemannia gamsii TaxID=64522 RepID=A0ABQ7KAQ7_9FUNG|nr:hypothetical protein BGZ96_012254 [Linnemannia gamsii]